MIARKIEADLKNWQSSPNKNPLIIKGCRQCGKTFTVLHFAKHNYHNVVYINFFEDNRLATAFDGPLDVDSIIMSLSALLGNKAKFVPRKTCIILDEIQECSNARTALKFFKIDGRFDILATGSLLGISGYRNDTISVPVGYETVINMYPLDFEEFLWANGITTNIIDNLQQHIDNCTPIEPPIHQRMRELLLQYVVVGGMPAVVNSFINNKQMNIVLQLQRDIVNGYRDDMVKYATPQNKSNIRECFDSIPKQLSKEYKKFQYSLIKKNSSATRYAGSLQWIEDAGIIARCYNLNITELPLDGNAIDSIFKVYMADIGLFVSMLEDGTQADILAGSLLAYKGAIFENLIADILHKAGRKLYYFHKDSGLEIDFVIRQNSQPVLVECKAVTGNAKSLKTIIAHPEKYHVYQAIKFGDYNVGLANQIKTLPLYLAFLALRPQ